MCILTQPLKDPVRGNITNLAALLVAPDGSVKVEQFDTGISDSDVRNLAVRKNTVAGVTRAGDLIVLRYSEVNAKTSLEAKRIKQFPTTGQPPIFASNGFISDELLLVGIGSEGNIQKGMVVSIVDGDVEREANLSEPVSFFFAASGSTYGVTPMGEVVQFNNQLDVTRRSGPLVFIKAGVGQGN